ncbi:hypothetical protein DFJ58DRAFT_848187 [Suillus subalutaceus]|uniref:uncharacterized protein n=1 Tax=Suillus subalutaceus TaxID=48586 RepID=UPI001B86A418|nr:uncharacterized protein DFJ58DRAFT_848187 [Suillus subalutaceus]KAG1831652.1 hypothetical protein DFJ58DRAFT_848187 [Suillus subalutaceus]
MYLESTDQPAYVLSALSADENKYKVNTVELKRPQRRTPPVARLRAHCTIKLSVDIMKLVQIVYLTVLAAASAAAGAIVVKAAARAESMSCPGACSSQPPLNCPTATAPYEWSPICWMCCSGDSSRS